MQVDAFCVSSLLSTMPDSTCESPVNSCSVAHDRHPGDRSVGRYRACVFAVKAVWSMLDFVF
jgi:hypothetical protein